MPQKKVSEGGAKPVEMFIVKRTEREDLKNEN